MVRVMSQHRRDRWADRIAAAHQARPQAKRAPKEAPWEQNLAGIKAACKRARRECERERKLLEEYEAERGHAIGALVEAEQQRHAGR
jgi:hypothetical protein